MFWTLHSRLTLTESIPDGMLFPSGSPHLQSITHTWTNLLNQANSSVNIAAFYLTLRDSDIGLTDPSAMQVKQLCVCVCVWICMQQPIFGTRLSFMAHSSSLESYLPSY